MAEQKGHRPYIMPDGRSLGQVLSEMQAASAKNQTASRSRRKIPEAGWTKPESVWQARDAGEASTSGAGDEDVLQKLGRVRKNRYLNDRLLRQMAGHMNAEEMQSLFTPVPFGHSHPSVFSRAATADVAPLWDLFRTIEVEKQTRTLQKWEAHVGDQQQQDGSAAAAETASAGALRNWARVPKRARQAMKAAGPAILEELELPILSFLERETDTELELEILDSYRRLLVHGLASFHSLALRSNTATLTLRVGNSRPQQGSCHITCTDVVEVLAACRGGGDSLTPALLDSSLGMHTYDSDASSQSVMVRL